MLINQLDDEIIKNLSQSELYILHYVYDHPDEVIDMSIQELAKAVAFSSATILRFCKKLNFSGFAEFKFALKQQNKEIANLKKPISSMDSITSLYDDIESTSLLIKERYLKEIIDLIDSNKRIHLYGEGISRIPVNYLEKLLFSIGRQNVYKYKSSRLAAHIASNANEDDILIAISTSGNYPTTVKIVKLFNLNHATIIAISPYTKNAIADLANINFRFFVNHRENIDTEYTSRLAIFYIIDVIFKTYLVRKEKE